MVESRQRGGARSPGCCQLACLQVQPGQQELAERSFAGQGRCGKEAQCRPAANPGLGIAAILVEDQRLVQVDQRGPQVILLASEEFARPVEQLQRTGDLALMCGSDGQKRQGLGGLVLHLQLLEADKGLLGKLGAFFDQI